MSEEEKDRELALLDIDQELKDETLKQECFRDFEFRWDVKKEEVD
jgi:hypothetical protein